MIKELLTIIKMLFKPIKNDDAVKVVTMQYFPFKGYTAMMWCGTIIKRAEYAQHVDAITLNHERIHLAQAKLKGSWILFYLSYLWNWAKHNPLVKSSYYLNKYEGEAYANELKDYYWMNYTGCNLHKYDLGRNYWRAHPSVSEYLNFIKSL